MRLESCPSTYCRYGPKLPVIWKAPTPPGQLPEHPYSLSHVIPSLNAPLSAGTILYCHKVGPNEPSWSILPNMAAVWISSKVCLKTDQYFSLGVSPQIDEKLLLLFPDEHGL